MAGYNVPLGVRSPGDRGYSRLQRYQGAQILFIGVFALSARGSPNRVGHASSDEMRGMTYLLFAPLPRM